MIIADKASRMQLLRDWLRGMGDKRLIAITMLVLRELHARGGLVDNRGSGGYRVSVPNLKRTVRTQHNALQVTTCIFDGRKAVKNVVTFDNVTLGLCQQCKGKTAAQAWEEFNRQVLAPAVSEPKAKTKRKRTRLLLRELSKIEHADEPKPKGKSRTNTNFGAQRRRRRSDDATT